MAGTLMVFGVSVYLGLERYLDWTLQKTLVSECRTIATELLPQLPRKDTTWLATEINEAYAPEVNSRFIRVVRSGTGVVYLSAAPKDGIFDPETLQAFEQYFQQNTKLHGRKGKLSDKVKIHMNDNILSITTTMQYQKRYFKYLTKKFLKKRNLREWLRILATNKQDYTLKYFNIHDQEAE